MRGENYGMRTNDVEMKYNCQSLFLISHFSFLI